MAMSTKMVLICMLYFLVVPAPAGHSVSDQDTFQMKLRSGTWIDTVPEDFRSSPVSSAERNCRNLWADVDLPFSSEKNVSTSVLPGQNGLQQSGFTYQELLSRMMEDRPLSPLPGLYSPPPSESDSSFKKESQDRVRTRSRSSNGTTPLFSTLKYDISNDKPFRGIPKLTICKRRVNADTPSSKTENPESGPRKTKRLKLIVGKESFHIDLEK